MVGALLTTATPAVAHDAHVIDEGDSLWAIAEAHGLSVQQLADANGIADPDLIRVGDTVTIPAPGRSSSGASAQGSASGLASGGAGATYVVEPGDTLWQIALDHGLGVGMLARQNDLSGSDPIIYPGQVLLLDPAGQQQSAPSSSAVSSRTTGAVAGQRVVDRHVVAPGDTLWQIAATYGVSTDAVASINDLAGDAIIRPGDELRIPGLVSTDLPADLRGSTQRMALAPVFDHWASEYDVPADLLKALTWFESGWNNDMVSSANAIGIGQILPITARFVSEYLVGEELDPTIPEHNIRLAARYLRYLLDHTGDTRLAVASYYQGLTATRRHGIYASSEFYVDGILALRWRFQ